MTTGWRTMFMSGHNDDGTPWGDVIVCVPAQNLSLRDDKLILLAHDFNQYLPGLSDDDLQEVMRTYTAQVYKILAEMTTRGLTQKPADDLRVKSKRKAKDAS